MATLFRKFPSMAAAVAALSLALSGLASASSDGRFLVRYDLGSKDTVMAALPAGAVIHHEFDDIGLMAVSMPGAAADALSQLSVVRGVNEDSIYSLSSQTTPYGIDMVRARDQWDADRDGVIDAGAATGEGIRLCIVDTGIYAAHEDLGGGGVDILAGRSWVDEPWDEDRQGHGTHVAGTVAAMNNGVGVVGTSPGTVDLIIADVFNDLGEGQFSSTILEAATWCADQGANIISMSLGGPLPDSGIEAGYQAIYDRGVLIIAAAGNDGGPVNNYPASYSSVVSVAAIDSTENVADFSNFVPAVEVAAPGVAVLSTYPFENAAAIDGGPKYAANSVANANPPGSYTGPLMDGGDCNTAPAPNAYTGAMVLCERGGAAFRVKIDNAAAGGAAGAILYNNAPGNFNGTYGDPCCSTIPSISLSQADGQDALNHLGKSTTIIVDLESIQGYAEVSGTSMATPHASATAAVHWSACTDLSNDQMRSHLSATTRDSQQDLLPGRDIFYGYGIVQVQDGVAALTDGIDEYDPAIGNGSGNNPANVECATTEVAGGEVHGGGWLNGASDKINFNIDAQELDGGLNGKIKIKDKAAGVRIDARNLTSFSQLGSDCGPVAAGSNAVEILADGTFNGQPASFRACAADNGEPGKGADQLYVECTSGCGYDTASAGSDGVLGGGNIQVKNVGDADSEGGSASTMTLGPVLLDTVDAGAMQVLTVTVRDANVDAVAGAPVTLHGSDGSTLEGTTGATGQAVFTVVLPASDVEYRATSGGAESNTVAPTVR